MSRRRPGTRDCTEGEPENYLTVIRARVPPLDVECEGERFDPDSEGEETEGPPVSSTRLARGITSPTSTPWFRLRDRSRGFPTEGGLSAGSLFYRGGVPTPTDLQDVVGTPTVICGTGNRGRNPSVPGGLDVLKPRPPLDEGNTRVTMVRTLEVSVLHRFSVSRCRERYHGTGGPNQSRLHPGEDVDDRPENTESTTGSVI